MKGLIFPLKKEKKKDGSLTLQIILGRIAESPLVGHLCRFLSSGFHGGRPLLSSFTSPSPSLFMGAGGHSVERTEREGALSFALCPSRVHSGCL